jgi:hypothetical protein
VEVPQQKAINKPHPPKNNNNKKINHTKQYQAHLEGDVAIWQ